MTKIRFCTGKRTAALLATFAPPSITRLNMQDHGDEMGTLVGVGGARQARVVYAENVHLGITHGKGLPFLALGQLDEPADVDGVLGMESLINFDRDLDLWGGHLGIYRAVEGGEDPRTAMMWSLPS